MQGLEFNIQINEIINVFLLTILLFTSVAVVLSRNLLSAAIYLSVFSLMMSAMYLVLGAPDVAMTEAAVGAGISTILILTALVITGFDEKKSGKHLTAFIVISLTTLALVFATLGLPSFGDPSAPANLHVAPYYINNTNADIGIPNIVTAVLASYRGYDTLGETFVIFTAGISVLLLLRKKNT